MIESDWYKRHNCDHAHCPNDCGDHPQPFMLAGQFICGRCAIVFGIISIMIPCSPETCND